MADFLFTEGSLTDSNAAHSTYKASSPALRGVPLERAHPSLQRLISVLFPADSGLRFLEAFLRLAQVEQETPEAGAYAVIQVRNQRELAQLLGMDYDRVNRYVLLLQKMHLLARHDEANGIVLALALDEPRLPHPNALDALSGYRPKVETFARKVKQRWLALLQAQDACTISCTPQFEQAIQPDKKPSTPHRRTVDLEDVLQAALDLYDAETARRLLHQIECRTSQRDAPTTTEAREVQASLDPTSSTSPTRYRLAHRQLSSEKGDSPSPIGDSPFGRAAQNGDSHRQNGDSPFTLATPKSDSSQKNGDSSIQKGDSPATGSPEKRRLASEKMGDSRATSAHTKGDSSLAEVATHLSNVNVTLLEFIKNVNVNVREVASDLCQIFGEHPQRQGYYHQLARQHSNPQAWLGALLETLFALQRGSVRKPGRYFYKRCTTLHQALPAETERLIAQFGTYTYAQLQEHLRGSSSVPQATAQATSSNQQPATYSRPASLPPAVTLKIPHDSQRAGMEEKRFRALYQRIHDEKQGYKLRAIPYQQQDGTYIILLTSFSNKHQRWIYTPQEWHEVYACLRQPGQQRSIFDNQAA